MTMLPDGTAMDPEKKQSGNGPTDMPMTADSSSTTTDETGAETPKMTRDSMVTVRLSEPPVLRLDSELGHQGRAVEPPAQSPNGGAAEDDSPYPRHSHTSRSTGAADRNRSLHDELGECGITEGESDCSDQEEVNWEELEKTEDEQTKDEETDNVCELQPLSSKPPIDRPQSTALLLARLEQENAKLATNPKSVKVQPVERPPASRPRPPSMAQLRQMVSGPTPPALRYSMLPPPAMTDLEFWAALVKDYQQTAARLPTLLSNKIRKGIPPPLRGVVWQSMSGARDAGLEEQYDRFGGESSPYELIIGKDLGRSFPGVDMFRDPEGDGQRMLGRVLKSFSLHDTRIGYCQGLAFLVGPLLMHMPDKQAFCVLVRLMERYDLRSCFLPDLSGLHVRIYQFRELLRCHLPSLWSHMEDLQVETAYVSQWFLSFFAVTCPLPMLFRIYDVIFAEGASETLMRVALSLMRKNEARLLSCTELEDVMQLLLSRGLWDCYHYNAEDFVQDFVGLSGVVTRERLSQLEQSYRESLVAATNAARTSDITTAATRFLGRIWAPSSSTSPKTATLTPSRPLSMLRRSASKQSLASTLNSIEASSMSVMSSSSTDATTISRDSSNTTEDETSSRESTPVGPKSTGSMKNADDNKYLHSQIEDLLTALSELQRNNALLTNDLQRERGEREEDRRAVRCLLDVLRNKACRFDDASPQAETDFDKSLEAGCTAENGEEDDAVILSRARDWLKREVPGEAGEASSTEHLSELLERVERRFRGSGKRRASSSSRSKPQLRAELLQTKDQLASAMSQNQEFNRRIHDLDQEMGIIREQLRESHGHVRALHQDKQRLEKQIYSLKSRPSSAEPVGSREAEGERGNKGHSGGLREFKLGRTQSNSSQGGGSSGSYSRRMSSLPQNSDSLAPPTPVDDEASTSEHDTLLLELVQSKTAEAIAKQEAEEMKQKLETLRKACGLAPGDSPNVSMMAGAAATTMTTTTTTTTTTTSASGAMGVFGRLTGSGSSGDGNAKSSGSTGSNSPAGGGGFWGWRR